MAEKQLEKSLAELDRLIKVTDKCIFQRNHYGHHDYFKHGRHKRIKKAH